MLQLLQKKRSSSSPKTQLSFSFPSCATVCKSQGVVETFNSAGSLLSVEGLGYVCEDKSAGPLRGALGGC